MSLIWHQEGPKKPVRKQFLSSLIRKSFVFSDSGVADFGKLLQRREDFKPCNGLNL